MTMIRALVIAATLGLAAIGCGGASSTPARTVEDHEEGGVSHPEEINAIHLSDDAVRDLRVNTTQVTARAGAPEVTVLGQVAADQARYAEVTPPTEGQVVRVLVDQNASVRAGTQLAELRSAALGRARADLLAATARRDLAQQTLDRKRTLAAERIVAGREVEEADAAFRAADAEARAAATSLRTLGIDDADAAADPAVFALRAPIAGTVISRRAVMGQFAPADMPLFTIADLSRIWVVAQVFERDAVNLQAGSVAHLTMAALPGEEFDGTVTQIGRQVDAGSRTVPVRIELANPRGVLKPGMSANARIEMTGQRRTMLVVPAAALQRVGQEWLAFVPKSAQEFEMRPVGRGRDVGNEVEVVSGLQEGDTVVVEGAFLLKAEAEKRRGGDEHAH